MRGTVHNGRASKDGAYSPKHNDRNFDISKAENIDPTRTEGNWYWQRSREPMTFEEDEKRFYNKYFADSLAARNERYRASRHKERIKTMDEYRTNKRYCPEETILQIGKAGDTVDPALLKEICKEHINWEIKTFPNVQVLNAALHVDEQGAPHMHERKVWIAHSADGLIVGQAKALEEMGIQRPHPEKEKDRYNNPKTTYTAMCREHFLEVCKKHGLEIELEPDKTSKRGLELVEYKRQQEEKKLSETEKHLEENLQIIEEQALSENQGFFNNHRDKVTVDRKRLEQIVNEAKMFNKMRNERDQAVNERDQALRRIELHDREVKEEKEKLKQERDALAKDKKNWSLEKDGRVKTLKKSLLELAARHPDEFKQIGKEMKKEEDYDRSR